MQNRARGHGKCLLLTIDLFVTGGVWFYWPMLGWGIGVAFHVHEVFFPDPEKAEKGARKILRRRKKDDADAPGDSGVHIELRL